MQLNKQNRTRKTRWENLSRRNILAADCVTLLKFDTLVRAPIMIKAENDWWNGRLQVAMQHELSPF